MSQWHFQLDHLLRAEKDILILCFKFSYVCTFSKTFSLVVFLYFLSFWSGTISISNYELKAYSETLQSSCSVSYMKLKIVPKELWNWTPTSKTLWFSFNSKVQQVLSDFSTMFPLLCMCSECIKRSLSFRLLSNFFLLLVCMTRPQGQQSVSIADAITI